MTTRWGLGICLSAVLLWTGCETSDGSETCRILFAYTYNDHGHIEELTLDENADESVDARVIYTNTYADNDTDTDTDTDNAEIESVKTKCVRSDGRVMYETLHELNASGRTVHALYEGEEVNVYVREYGESVRREQRRFSWDGEYDERNRLVVEALDLDDDGTPDEREMYHFNDDGYKIRYEIDEGADDTVDTTTYYSYTFTDTDDGMKYESILWEEVGLITTITEFTYEYDEEGRLTVRTIDIRQDGVPEEICTMTYRDDGEEELCESFANGALTKERIERRDAEGRVVWTFSEQADDGPASQGTYTYDEAGNRASVLSEVRDNPEDPWRETALSTYTYDEEGTKLSETKEVYNWGPSTQTCADSYLPRYQLTVRR